MASVSFHHGTRVFESAETPVLVKLAQTAVEESFGYACAPNMAQWSKIKDKLESVELPTTVYFGGYTAPAPYTHTRTVYNTGDAA